MSSLATLDLAEYRAGARDPGRWSHLSLTRQRHRALNLRHLERAGWACERCGAGERLTVHHLTRLRNREDDREVLCEGCHLDEHGVAREAA